MQVGSGLAQRETIVLALNDAWLRENGRDATRVQVVQETGKNMSHAFNVAASYARGHYLLFFLESMEMPPRSDFTYPHSDNVLEYLVSVIKKETGRNCTCKSKQFRT